MTGTYVTIQWEKTNLTKLKEMKNETGSKDIINSRFYAFSRGKNLLFLGFAYRMEIWDEAMEILDDDEIKSKGLVIWLGHIMDTDYGRITIQIVRDVRNLLIFVEQPTYNKQYKKSYHGRKDLVVKNSKFSLVRPCFRVENGMVYKTCK